MAGKRGTCECQGCVFCLFCFLVLCYLFTLERKFSSVCVRVCLVGSISLTWASCSPSPAVNRSACGHQSRWGTAAMERGCGRRTLSNALWPGLLPEGGSQSSEEPTWGGAALSPVGCWRDPGFKAELFLVSREVVVW